MSVPQLISPMLDGFVMGDPISDHDGVRSCPAMHLETEQKYIVKIISVPASQSKIDALLLAGAFEERDSALAYFKDLADGVLEEAELLQKLSRYEGFVAFDTWQNVPMEDGETGFDIYLLSPYRPTLDSLLKSNEMTHLNAVNLGLDLCAALSVARRSGYLYSNLRPSNVYICNEREFRIGDLGFIGLSSLPYASLPDKYHSDYTPPEICDAYSALNSTMDIYAVGLILYQAYNGGKLPPVGFTMEAPRYADYELSQIILKACAAGPEARWQDPVQMGQALANYLQSNTVNDTPITPVVVEEAPVEPVEIDAEEATEPTTEDILAEVDEALDAAPAIIPAAPVEETVVPPAPAVEEEPVIEETAPVVDDTAAVVDQIAAVVEDVAAAVIEEPVVDEEPAVAVEDDAPVVDEAQVPIIADETPVDEPVNETAQILAQADDLIAHQLPDPVVAPEEIEVTLPVVEETPQPAAEEDPQQSEEDQPVEEDAVSEEAAVEEEESTSEEEAAATPAPQRKKLKLFGIIAAIVLFLGIAGYLFYQYYYTQTIHAIVLSGSEDKLTVSLATEIPSDKLSVKCTDTHGNALTADVENGVAIFEGLKPGTTYKLEVRIEGFHQLVGETTKTYITDSQTVIGGFYAATGAEESSVILSFTVQGPDSPQWTVIYSTEGEAENSISFGGHLVTINGLTVGKEYTFKLQPYTHLYLSGTNTVTYVPSPLVYAEQLQLVSFQNQQLTVSWKTPEGVTVPKWHIRCYNDAGFDQTLSTSENSIVFEGLTEGTGYNIEVTAEGMTLGVRTYMSSSFIDVTKIETDDTNRNNLVVKWEFEGDAPADGWLLLYSLDDSTDRQVIRCTEATGTITPLVPGAKYTITVQPADGSTAFNATLEYQAPAPVIFNSYGVTADNMEFEMCLTPNVTNWDRYDVKQYTTSFKVGDSLSFVMHLTKSQKQSTENVVALYVIRDADGNIVSSKYESRTWNSMWQSRYGKLTIPVMPEEPGTYSVSIYFNGAAVTKQNFTIVAE